MTLPSNDTVVTSDAPDQLEITSEIGPFAIVPTWVLQIGLTGGELATYVALRSFANIAGKCWPTVDTIAGRARTTRRTVEKALARFRDLGLMTSHQRHNTKTGAVVGCTYVLRDIPSAPPVRANGAPPSERSPRTNHREHTNVPSQLALSSDVVKEPRKSARRQDVELLCNRLVERIAANGSSRPVITEKWRTEARLLLDKDGPDGKGRPLAQAMQLITWCQEDEFWRGNVLSMPTFRRQYDKVRLARERGDRPKARADGDGESWMRRRMGEQQ